MSKKTVAMMTATAERDVRVGGEGFDGAVIVGCGKR